MPGKLKISLFIISVLFMSGCNSNKVCSVKIYSPEYMTFNKQYESFNDACRKALIKLNDNEGEEKNSIHEKVMARTANGKYVLKQTYYKTKDDDGYEYIITSTTLGNNNPVVTLETTNPDKNTLMNALRDEFTKKGFKVKTMFD